MSTKLFSKFFPKDDSLMLAILYSVSRKIHGYILEAVLWFHQSQEILAHYVWQDEWNVHKSEDDERTLLGKVCVSFMLAFPKCLEKVSDYCHWLSLKNESVDIWKAKEIVLWDPSCFDYFLKKEFLWLRQYRTSPANPGVRFRMDGIRQKLDSFAKYLLDWSTCWVWML